MNGRLLKADAAGIAYSLENHDFFLWVNTFFGCFGGWWNKLSPKISKKHFNQLTAEQSRRKFDNALKVVQRFIAALLSRQIN